MIITGGSGVFTAGDDIDDFMRADTARPETLSEGAKFLYSLALNVKPIIAAVDGASIGMGTVVIATVLNSWFERRRGLALSLAFNGATCGGIILVPLLLSLTGSIGFRSAMLAATLAMMVLVLPV
ncbi:enoyl-CoA hydratase-related protein, partial [Bradyrhizobium ottawaense]|uniref:enoyl-CoA hydratase-related protein n=1 Tax=Bradyrhizobium ottawaense TaxID=931866 RepID=UPI0030C780D1